MAITTLTINGAPVENFGLGVSALGTWLDVPTRNYGAVQLPVRPGLVPVSTGSSIGDRALGMKFYVQPSSLLDRRNKLALLFGQLAGKLEISTVEDPSKVCYGYLTQIQTTTPFRELLSPEIYADVGLTCFDPLWYDREPKLYGGLSAGNWVSLLSGGAPMRRIKYWIYGAATNPAVNLVRRQNTMLLAQMRFTVTLLSTDYLEVDCDAYTITKYTSGVASNALSTLNSLDTFFSVDEPQSAVVSNDYITLLVSAGSMAAAHYRAYWA